jgi:diamine N-acetyltransferase
MVELKSITEDNFIDAFNLTLAQGQEQERFVSHPVRDEAVRK